MIRKSLYSLLIISLSLFACVNGFAVTLSTNTATRMLVTSEAEFPFYDAQITHNGVDFVSAIDGILNIKSSVDFGSYVSATAKMIYYFNDAPSSSVTVDKGNISKNTDFYIATPKIQDNYEKINYQIKIALKKENDEQDYFVYWPQQLTASSDTFHTAQITSTKSEVIDDTSKETVIKFFSGNQEYGNTRLVIPEQALSAPTTITIEQLPVPDNLLPSVAINKTSGSAKNQMVALYSVNSSDNIEILKAIYAEFFYGIETTETKFALKYRTDESSDWEKVNLKNTDTANKLVSANITKLGQYGIFVKEDLSDKDYRPEKKSKIKAKIANGTYEGFRFNNLQEGDVVKIYNINGKKIAEITNGDSNGFVWNGKRGTNNSGDWAESGTYIYQIKLKEKGKVVSGTIAFVW